MRGFTLVELLVAMTITLIVAAATLSFVGPAHEAFQVQPESADLHQRVRVGLDALQRDILMAGAGMYAAGAVGPLHQTIAPVMPYRAFGAGSDTAGGTYFRADAISVVFVPSTPSQTILSTPMPAGGLDIDLENAPTCPAATASQVCGFAAGDQVLIFDRTGAWEVFTVERPGGAGVLTLKGPSSDRAFAAGANVTKARAVAYALKTDPTSGAFQLVRAEGSDPAQPLLDHVVRLSFQYFGDPEPPHVLDQTDARPRASYGPSPPSLDQTVNGWPAGENCTFTVVDGYHAPRLATLGAAAEGTEIPAALMTDGPWCPDAAARNRYDADLLRIRRVRVTLRVQTAVLSLRGPAGVLFTNGGLSRRAGHLVPDFEIQLDVTPRNLNLAFVSWPADHE
jgi:prepilin-type N-terminal cleavage/methylation domain-containing protein